MTGAIPRERRVDKVKRVRHVRHASSRQQPATPRSRSPQSLPRTWKWTSSLPWGFPTALVGGGPRTVILCYSILQRLIGHPVDSQSHRIHVVHFGRIIGADRESRWASIRLYVCWAVYVCWAAGLFSGIVQSHWRQPGLPSPHTINEGQGARMSNSHICAIKPGVACPGRHSQDKQHRSVRSGAIIVAKQDLIVTV